MNNIEASVAALLESTDEDAFLVIAITGTADFVQMSAFQGTAELDFPQVTPRQKELRPVIEKVCGDLGLNLVIITASDGSEFLDYELPVGAGNIAETISQILLRVFDAQQDTPLEFEANGFDIPAV